MHWSFYYAGPIEPTQDANCTTCLATLQKKCPAHGTSATESCAHCAAAKGAPCHAHWGVKRALEEHATLHGLDAAALEDFARVKAIALADLAHVGKGRPNCTVRLRGFRDDGERDLAGERELEIDIATS